MKRSLQVFLFGLVALAAVAASTPPLENVSGVVRKTVSDHPHRVLRGYHSKPLEKAAVTHGGSIDRALIVDDDTADIESTTVQPSPTPTLPPNRIFGVGVGVFVLWVYFLVCGIGCFDLYTGNSGVRHPKLYNKPYNACVCCLFWYAVVILYLAAAPRDTETEAVGDKVYATNFYAKYTMMLILGCAMWYLVITAYFVDYGNEELVFRPVDHDLEKQRNPAQARSSV
jgi:hypothetical protein